MQLKVVGNLTVRNWGSFSLGFLNLIIFTSVSEPAQKKRSWVLKLPVL